MIVSDSRFEILKNSQFLREMYEIDETDSDEIDGLSEDFSEILSESASQTPEQLGSAMSGGSAASSEKMPIDGKEKTHGTSRRGKHQKVIDASSVVDDEEGLSAGEHESIAKIREDLKHDILVVSQKVRSSKDLKGVNKAISKIIRKFIKRVMASEGIDEQEILRAIGFIIAHTALGFSYTLFGKRGKEVYDDIVAPMVKQMDQFLKYKEEDGKRVLEFDGFEFSKKFGDPNKFKPKGRIKIIRKSKVGIHVVMNHIHKKIVDMTEEHDVEEFHKKAQMMRLLGLGLGIIIHGIWSGLTVKYSVKIGEKPSEDEPEEEVPTKEEENTDTKKTDTKTSKTSTTGSSSKTPEQLKVEMSNTTKEEK